ncbi:formimidoylglutamase [Danxiaibacter flavus]|uniref:Formimidoylglutamase n=1 Tax=Danxiaibacter flavus TaxID=3049108 RepID=A0ABV3ZFL0_9BACT|nr:formimidoylglutamase [Chitinophagaceae bacterium DXS]
MQHLTVYNRHNLAQLTNIRRFETKMGERILVLENGNNIEQAIAASPAKFVLFGIPEDIGVKANMGVGGADTVWMPFLKSFLNIQSNDFLQGDEILLLGHLDFSELALLIETNAQGHSERVEAYRHAVETIDNAVEHLVKVIAQNNKIPIVIGGGHNNAYGCIKGAAKGLYQAGLIPIAEINAINLDAHSDYRPTEGRHSGNAFRYAEEDGYLEKYCVIGLHENYLPQNVWMDIVNNPFMDVITYEDIFLHEKHTFLQAVAHATSFTDDTYCGIELDLDIVEKALSSATSPVGITTFQARQYIHYAAGDCQVAYLHICEGATQLNDGRKDPATGKLVSYLVSDFIKALVVSKEIV